MAWYRVAVVNEEKRPLARVQVDAVSLDSWPDVSDTQTTGENGSCYFSGLTGPHYFVPRVRRIGGSVGDRSFTGSVEVQVVGMKGGAALYDYIVDENGEGTHLTLGEDTGALAQAIADGEDRSIWMMNSETLTRAEDISALAMNKHISVHAAEGHRVTLTAKASTSLFAVAPTGTDWTASVWGMCGMDFRNIYLKCDGAGDIFDINDNVGGNALAVLDNCFIDGRSLIDLAASKLAPSLWLRNCRNGTGTLVNIYTGVTASAMDKLLIEDCELSVARVVNAPYMPDETRVSGGELACSDYFMQGQTVAWTELYVSGVWLIHSSATYAMFHTGSGALSIRDITIVSCYYQGTHASAVLGNFSSHAAAPCQGLTIVGNMIVNTQGGGTAITVDANWQNVRVDNNYRGWTTNYSGPAGTGGAAAHTILDGDVHTDTVVQAVTAGSIIIGNDTPKWDELVIAVPAANVRNVLGIDNAETMPSWKTALDATNPAAVAAAAASGTSLIFAHRDHIHKLGILTTKGDLLGYSTLPARLGVGSDGYILVADSGEVLGIKWAAPSAVSGHAILDGSVHTDSVADAVTRGSLIYGNATPKWDELVKGTSGYFLKAGADDIAWAAITEADISDLGTTVCLDSELTSHIGTPAAHHALVTLAADAQVLLNLSTQELGFVAQVKNTILAGPTTGANADPTFRVLVAADLPAGTPTGLTPVRGSIIYGDATPAWAVLAVGGAGTYLQSDGTDAAWAVLANHDHTGDAGDGGQITEASISDLQSYVLAHAMLDGSVHTDSVADAVTRGSLIYGNATPKWDELVIGAAGTLLISDGTDVSWGARAGTAELADVAATEAAGSDTKVAYADHVHALGIGTTRGDILVWNATPVASRLAVGAAGTVLIGGTDPAYSGSPALSGTLTVDTVNEYTGAAGVTIEGIQLKDGVLTADLGWDADEKGLKDTGGVTRLKVNEAGPHVDVVGQFQATGTMTIADVGVDLSYTAQAVSGQSRAFRAFVAADPQSETTGPYYYGLDFTAQVVADNVQDVGRLYGMFGSTEHRGDGTLTSAHAVEARVTATVGTGTITTARGLVAYGLCTTPSSIGTLQVARLQGWAGTQSGTITTLVNLRLEAASGAGTNWAVQSAGGDSYHVGNLRIGSTTAPTVALDVTGIIGVNGEALLLGAAGALVVRNYANTAAAPVACSALSQAFPTEAMVFVDAGSAAATEQDWIEVTVGGNTGYIRVFAAK